MLMKAEKSCLLMVDVQEKLVGAVHKHQRLLDNCAWLMQVATVVDVPMLVSEQYPQGLGSTVAPLRALAPDNTFMSKMHFSCGADDDCMARIEQMDRKQFVIAGIEAHVCVLQTAINLREASKEVFLVADAVSSRHPRDAQLAIERMREAGIQIVTKEMVLFEWAYQSGTAQFKELSKRFLK